MIDHMGIPGARKLYVDTAIGRVAYIEAGGDAVGDDPEGPRPWDGVPVVLLHGLGATSETWYYTIRALEDAHQVVALDLWGHGESEGPRLLTEVAPIVEALDATLDALKIERAVVVGHSLGGLVAARYALWKEERVAKLALVDAGGIGRELSWLLKLSSVPLLGKLVFFPAILAVRYYGRRVFNPPYDVDVDLFKALHDSRVTHVTADVVRRALSEGVGRIVREDDAFILPRLGEIDVPVLVLWGQKDRLFPVSQIVGIKDKGWDVDVHVFPDTGHWPYAETPVEFNRWLMRFIDDTIGHADENLMER